MTPIQRFWHGQPYNDIPPQMGVTITRPTLKPGDWYAEAVVVHLLTRAENMGNHNLYLDVIDEDGRQVRGAQMAGRNNNIHLFAVVDKPVNEFGCNFAMFAQDTLNCWVAGAPDHNPVVSDVAGNFSTRWGGAIVGGQDYGHVSFYVIFQLKRDARPPEPPEPPIPPEPSDQFRAGFELAKRRAIEAIEAMETPESEQ